MNSIWATIRTSLVQKVTDIRKSLRRKSQQQSQSQENKQSSTVSLSTDHETNN